MASGTPPVQPMRSIGNADSSAFINQTKLFGSRKIIKSPAFMTKLEQLQPNLICGGIEYVVDWLYHRAVRARTGRFCPPFHAKKPPELRNLQPIPVRLVSVPEAM